MRGVSSLKEGNAVSTFSFSSDTCLESFCFAHFAIYPELSDRFRVFPLCTAYAPKLFFW